MRPGEIYTSKGTGSSLFQSKNSPHKKSFQSTDPNGQKIIKFSIYSYQNINSFKAIFSSLNKNLLAQGIGLVMYRVDCQNLDQTWFELTQDTPYLAPQGPIMDVFCNYFAKNDHIVMMAWHKTVVTPLLIH